MTLAAKQQKGKTISGEILCFLNTDLVIVSFHFCHFRCLTVIDPVKGETKSSESLHTFLFRLRQALMAAFSRTLTKFEETVRTQRERRNELNWNFCNYFLLQVLYLSLFFIVFSWDMAKIL